MYCCYFYNGIEIENFDSGTQPMSMRQRQCNVTLRKYSANSSDQQIRQQRRKYVRPGKIIKVSLGALRIRYAIIANDPIIRLRKEPTIEARKLNRK